MGGSGSRWPGQGGLPPGAEVPGAPPSGPATHLAPLVNTPVSNNTVAGRPTSQPCPGRPARSGHPSPPLSHPRPPATAMTGHPSPAPGACSAPSREASLRSHDGVRGWQEEPPGRRNLSGSGRRLQEVFGKEGAWAGGGGGGGCGGSQRGWGGAGLEAWVGTGLGSHLALGRGMERVGSWEEVGRLARVPRDRMGVWGGTRGGGGQPGRDLDGEGRGGGRVKGAGLGLGLGRDGKRRRRTGWGGGEDRGRVGWGGARTGRAGAGGARAGVAGGWG